MTIPIRRTSTLPALFSPWGLANAWGRGKVRGKVGFVEEHYFQRILLISLILSKVNSTQKTITFTRARSLVTLHFARTDNGKLTASVFFPGTFDCAVPLKFHRRITSISSCFQSSAWSILALSIDAHGVKHLRYRTASVGKRFSSGQAHCRNMPLEPPSGSSSLLS